MQRFVIALFVLLALFFCWLSWVMPDCFKDLKDIYSSLFQ